MVDKFGLPSKLFCLGRKKLESGFGPGAHMQLVINMPKMPAHGAVGETDASGYLFVGKPCRQQFQNFALARRKTFNFGRNGNRFLEGNNDLAGDFP